MHLFGYDASMYDDGSDEGQSIVMGSETRFIETTDENCTGTVSLCKFDPLSS